MALIVDSFGTPLSSSAPGRGAAPTANPAATPGGTPDGAVGAVDAGDIIKDASMRTFMADVIDASHQVPVIVDFWAPWCEPCKTLGPMLERLVLERAGAVRMVKVNVDEHQEIAAQFRVQSIPTVYAMKDGQPIDGFASAISESEIRAFLDRISPEVINQVQEGLDQAQQLLDAGHVEQAADLFQQVLMMDQTEARAFAGYARCLMALGRMDDARGFLGQLPPQMTKHPDLIAVRTSLELAEKSGGLAESDSLKAAVDANPSDCQARFDYALALFNEQKPELAVETLLYIVATDRDWNDDGARKELLKIFEALGFSHPASVAGRRKLSTVLFS